MLPIRTSRNLLPVRVHLHSPIDSGLGPLRRMMTIAEAISVAMPSSQVLLTTGSPRATWFQATEGISIVKLPTLEPDEHEGRAKTPKLVGGPTAEDLRRQLLLQVHRAWAPQVLIVDQEPLGAGDELEPILRDAPARGLRTLLGLRDAFATGETMPAEWDEPRVRSTLLERYDRILVFGSPEIFDPRLSYRLPEALARRLEFTGYIARNVPSRPPRAGRSPRVLFSAGSGASGGACIEALLDALEQRSPGFESHVVLGPYLPAALSDAIGRRAAAIDRVRVHSACSDVPELLASCDAVVSTAGYHTAIEVLQSRLPALFCPRSFPSREQLLRAERFASHGYASCQASAAPDELLQGVEELLQRGLSTRPLPSMDGTTKIVHAVQQLCQSPQRLETRLGQVQ
jgi:predicted glycosyltransferase